MKVYEYTFTRHKVAEVGATIRGPQVAASIAQDLIGNAETEELVVFALNTKNAIIGLERVYRGNVAGSAVRVGEVFRMAVRLNATSILVAHNHPSGDTAASSEDTHITGELAEAGRLLDIPLLDHIIVTADNWISLRSMGVIA